MGDDVMAFFRFLLCTLATFSFVSAFSKHPTEPGEKFESHYLVIIMSILYFFGLLFSGYKLLDMRASKLMSGETSYVSGYVRSSIEKCYKTCHWESTYVYKINNIEYTGVIDRQSPLQTNYWATFRVSNEDKSVFEIISYDKKF